ncbi:unnamed protein product [Cyprideis torosa]|uniref:Uncharacterized protein n=1 Tax=Cyprideis torosa TaxID=163714 RepID=A0A7R8ZTE1_9CRUS|nr:unnamed protein product [Cyprideis torosa]CAG0897794.1 unnamed protein product [Cyprideis torosa]
MRCKVAQALSPLQPWTAQDQSKKFPKTNYYILHLAIADGLFLVGLTFFIPVAIKHYWSMGALACKIHLTTCAIGQFTSSFLLTIMAADRYYSVNVPFPRVQLTDQRGTLIAKVVSISAWFFAAILTTPIFILGTTVPNRIHGRPMCEIVWMASHSENHTAPFIIQPHIYTYYCVFFSFVLPLICIAAAYIGLLLKLRRRDSPRRSITANNSTRKQESKNTKVRIKVSDRHATVVVLTCPSSSTVPLDVPSPQYTLDVPFSPPHSTRWMSPFPLPTVPLDVPFPVTLDVVPSAQSRWMPHSPLIQVSRLVLALIAVYVICWLPHWACQLSLINSSAPSEADPAHGTLVVVIFLFTHYLTCLNSALNPILYSWYNKSVRRNFFNTLAFRREPTFTAGAVTVGGLKSRVGVVDVELRELRPRTPEEDDSRIEVEGGDAKSLLRRLSSRRKPGDENKKINFELPSANGTK